MTAEYRVQVCCLLPAFRVTLSQKWIVRKMSCLCVTCLAVYYGKAGSWVRLSPSELLYAIAE